MKKTLIDNLSDERLTGWDPIHSSLLTDSLLAALEREEAYKRSVLLDQIRDLAEKLRIAELAAKDNRNWADAALARFTAPIVCICGSTRFKQAWIAENARLTGEGNIVLAVGLWGHHERVFPDEATKKKLDELHLRKIDLCDWVWVLDVGGYIGESTRNEIAYAEAHGKQVRYLSKEIPDYVEPVDPLVAALSRAEEAEEWRERYEDARP
jgi:hypothetical protein